MVNINNRNVMVWGTGGYCAEKIEYVSKVANVIGFVDRKEKIFNEVQTITPDSMNSIDFDYILVLSNFYIEIIKDILAYGIDPVKIIPGIAVEPLLFDEVDLITDETNIQVDSEGNLIYNLREKVYIIKDYDDWDLVRSLILDTSNATKVKNMSCLPVGKKWGSDRGGSIVRYYLEDFFNKNALYISGNVLEIGDRNYTMEYGSKAESYVLHYGNKQSSKYEIYGDLVTGEGLKENFYDCVILTQVFAFVSDIVAAIENIYKSLKPGGRIIITDCGITPIGRYEKSRYGHYWSFTTKSISYLFDDERFDKNIVSYGNVKVACAFLMGMSYCEIDNADLDYVDEDYQLVIAANIKKK